MLSASAPPCAPKGLVTPCTNATLCLSTVSVPLPTLPEAPPPTRYSHLIESRPVGGTQPLRPSPKEISPLIGSLRQCREPGWLSKRLSTSCQRTQLPPPSSSGWMASA